MGKENPKFTKCDFGKRRCDLVKCLEYAGTPEKPCVAALHELAVASSRIFDMNLMLGILNDPRYPSSEEFRTSFTLTPTIYAVARRLGIDEKTYLLAVAGEIARIYNGRLNGE